MKNVVVSALASLEARLFAMKLWSLGTQAKKLKNHVAK